MELVDDRIWHCLEPFIPPPNLDEHVVPAATPWRTGEPLMAFCLSLKQGFHGRLYRSN